MALPWVRLDSNVGTHDKILSLIDDPSPKKWQALSSYFIALGWSGGQETDGRIPRAALSFVHGTPATARLLVTYRLWAEGTACWHIVNFAERQQTSTVSAAKREAQSEGGQKGNCKRWHAPACRCCVDGSEPIPKIKGVTR
jgi:hypothetical protein